MINNKPLFVFTVLTATMLIWLSDEISMKLSLIVLALGFLFIIWPLSIKIRIANEEEKAQKIKDNERHYVSLQNKLGAINISSQIQEDGLLELVDLLTNPNQEELKKQKDELLQQAAQNFKKSRERLSEISKISLNFVSSKITSTELHFLIEALEGKVVLDSSSIRLLEEKNNLKLDLKDSAFTAITDVANSIDGECSIKVREVRLNNFKDIFNPILFRKAIKITISGNISKEPEITHAKRFVELHHFGKFEIKDSMSETFGEVSITFPIKTVTTNSVSSLENTLLPVYKKAGNFSYIFGISLIFLLVTAEWKGKGSADALKTTGETLLVGAGAHQAAKLLNGPGNIVRVRPSTIINKKINTIIPVDAVITARSKTEALKQAQTYLDTRQTKKTNITGCKPRGHWAVKVLMLVACK